MTAEHFDVLVVGARLSGIGAVHALQTHCPGRRYAILEGREAIGGTWDLFRYPGVRSDTDMFTLDYGFKPWTRPESMAEGGTIAQYARETAAEFGIDQHIRFKHKVCSASWSGEAARWTVQTEVGAERTAVSYTCDFLYLCSGYYDHAQGFAPDLPGLGDFKGQVIHPQFWPEALDYRGKRVVVIGSGATAITIVPSMSVKAAHVTMLQRSPGYVASLPAHDGVANFLRRWLPPMLAHKLTRGKNIAFATLFYKLCRGMPEFAKKLLRAGVAKSLPPDFAVDTHFKPHYAPWDERVCFVRDGDLFEAVSSGHASIVTDHIASFTPEGVQLASGKQLAADIVVTATGLRAVSCGGVNLHVDGRAVELSRTYAFRGLMLSGVPNLAFCFGYTNNSYTLRADLVSRYVTRLLNHMGRNGYRIVRPTCDDAMMTPEALIGLRSGHVQRAVASFPKQGARSPWRMVQSYYHDLFAMRWGSVTDPALVFAKEPTT